LGTSSRNAVLLEVEKVNAAGGLAGRQIEMVIRDSKGQPQEAARVARELVNTDGCEWLIDGEASSGSFAVHEVARDLGVLCVHTCSEASSL
ncbi:ABC transporter substrate-binding protein, partial [Vibrio parahaemolyticus]